MRENKFRGKRKDTGEWVYGYLADKDVITDGVVTDDYSSSVMNKAWQVIPETVGRYVELKDINGKEMYDEDIFIVRVVHDGDEYVWNSEKQKPIPQVIKRIVGGFDFGGSSRILQSPSDFEVIGNTFDNPDWRKY